MDIKAKIEEIVKKITGDAQTKALFQKDPVQAVEKVIGVDLPDEQVKAIIAGVQAKLTGDQAAGVIGKVKGLFGK